MNHLQDPEPGLESLNGRTLASGDLLIKVGGDGEEMRVSLQGELDLSSANALTGELDRLFDGRSRAIVLDLEQLEFIDSTGIACLVGAVRRDARGVLRVAGARGEVERLFRITGLDDYLPQSD